VVYEQHSPHGVRRRGGSLSRAQPVTASREAAPQIKQHYEPIRMNRSEYCAHSVFVRTTSRELSDAELIAQLSDTAKQLGRIAKRNGLRGRVDH
jgi:hypothetical protein